MKKVIVILAVLLLGANRSYGTSAVLKQPLQQIKNQDYKGAAKNLYNIIFSSKVSSQEKIAARYYFGYALMKLKLYQVAAFPLIVVAKEGSPGTIQKSFEHLVTISDSLNDTELLDFTLEKLDSNNLGEVAKEFYNNRMAQALMRENKLDEAAKYLNFTLAVKPDNEEALYTLALVKLKQNNTADAITALEKIYGKYFSRAVTDLKKQKAGIALARAYYQAKRWDDAIGLYREIPKDHPIYRQAQIELTWSLFRASKFRSAMSAIQTLHTPFYENFYDPESLILRTIILIFVCQNDEAEKALMAFQKNYNQAYARLADLTNTSQTPEFYSNQIDEAQKYLKAIKTDQRNNYNGQVPFFIVRSLMDEPPLKNKLEYQNRVQLEKNRIAKIFSSNDEASLRKYAIKILDIRQKGIRKAAGSILKRKLEDKTQELALLTNDVSLLNYEIISGKKQKARQQYIKEVNNSVNTAIDQNESRDFYVKSGYRYWPFDGEYWKDEIGNYQYLGVNRCDQDQ